MRALGKGAMFWVEAILLKYFDIMFAKWLSYLSNGFFDSSLDANSQARERKARRPSVIGAVSTPSLEATVTATTLRLCLEICSNAGVAVFKSGPDLTPFFLVNIVGMKHGFSVTSSRLRPCSKAVEVCVGLLCLCSCAATDFLVFLLQGLLSVVEDTD